MSPDEYNLIIREGIDLKADPQTIEAVGLYFIQGLSQVKAAEITGAQKASVCRLVKRIKKAYNFASMFCMVKK